MNVPGAGVIDRPALSPMAAVIDALPFAVAPTPTATLRLHAYLMGEPSATAGFSLSSGNASAELAGWVLIRVPSSSTAVHTSQVAFAFS